MLCASLLLTCGNGTEMAEFALFSPGHSISSSIDLLLMLLVGVASLLSHAW